MESFREAVASMFTQADGYYSFVFGDVSEFELCIEPLLYGQFYVALYRRGDFGGDLIGAKLPVRAGGPA